VRLSHEYECFNWLRTRLARHRHAAAGLHAGHQLKNNFDMLPLIGAKKKKLARRIYKMEFYLKPDEEAFAEEFLGEAQIKGQKIWRPCRFRWHEKFWPLKRWPLKKHADWCDVEPGAAGHPGFCFFSAGPEEDQGSSVVLAQANRDLTLEAKGRRKTAADGGVDEAICSALLRRGTRPSCNWRRRLKVPQSIVPSKAPNIERLTKPALKTGKNKFTLVKNPGG